MTRIRNIAVAAIAALLLAPGCSEDGPDAARTQDEQAPAQTLADNPVTNPGFEEGADGDAPPGWAVNGAAEGASSAEAARTGALGLAVRSLGGAGPGPGVLVQTADAAAFRGQRVRLSVSGRAVSAEGPARPQLWLRADGPDGVLGISNSDPAGRIDGPDWSDYAIVAAVPEAAQRIAFGVIFAGQGETHLDDFAIAAAGPLSEGQQLPAPLAARGVDNLAAFARLYGYVRFFHPSDQAAAADWDAVALAGVQRVEGAADAEALRIALLEVFSPLAPTLRILPAGGPAPDMDFAPDADLVAWRRTGLGQNPSPNVYNGAREAPLAGLPDLAPLDLGDGLTAYVPLKAARDADGRTLPAASGAPPAPAKPDGFLPSGDDRASRLASVVIAWNVFQHFYPYWDVAVVDWPDQLRRSLRRAAQDPDAAAFDETMDRLVAALGDGHGNAFRTGPNGVLPLEWAWIEDSLVVTRADPGGATRPGDVVTEIGGEPVAALIAQWEARSSAATPQFLRVRALQRLAQGPAGRTVTLTLARDGGAVEAAELAFAPATGALRYEARPEPITELAPGILYVDLTRLADEAFDPALDRMAAAEGLIFDMRGYPAGNAAIRVLPHLADGPITSHPFNLPIYWRPDQADAEFRNSSWNLTPQAPRFSADRVVFLTDGRAISYAESVMGVVDGNDLGLIVGSPTAGTNGNIDRYVLPTGHNLIWTGMQVVRHDGSPHHGVGVLPDIPVAPTIAGVRAGRDEVLEAGLRAAGG